MSDPLEVTAELMDPNRVELTIPEAGLPVEPKALGLLYFKATLAEQIAKRIRAHTKTVLESGQEVSGLFLKPGSRSSSVSSTYEVFKILKNEFGESLSSAEFLKCCSVSMKQLEGLYHMKADSGTISDNAKELRELLSTVIETKRTSPTVAFSKPDNRQ